MSAEYAKPGTVQRTDREDKPVRLHLGSMGYVDMSVEAAEGWARRLLAVAHPDQLMFLIPVDKDEVAS